MKDRQFKFRQLSVYCRGIQGPSRRAQEWSKHIPAVKAAPEDPIMQELIRVEKIAFDCPLTIKKCLRSIASPATSAGGATVSRSLSLSCRTATTFLIDSRLARNIELIAWYYQATLTASRVVWGVTADTDCRKLQAWFWGDEHCPLWNRGMSQ